MTDFSSFTTPDLIEGIRHMEEWLKNAVLLDDQYSITAYQDSIKAAQAVIDRRKAEVI